MKTSWKISEKKLGFDSRIFLDKNEWMTYRKEHPVRFARLKFGKIDKQKKCEVCNLVDVDSKFTIAHKIPFIRGIIKLGLTPEFLNRKENLIYTHQKECNKQAELDIEGVFEELYYVGVRKLPEYITSEFLDFWDKFIDKKFIFAFAFNDK